MEKKWKLVNFCEFDKYAIKSYCAIHNVDSKLNLGDITKVDETKLDSFNMICGGSPCQDFSVAGKQKGSVWTCKECGTEYNPLTVHFSLRDKCPICGSNNIEKTRSSLLVEWLRIIRANKPNFGIYENVKNIVGNQFKETFNMFTSELEEYGYNVYWKVLNAKNYGIPQNRERVYLILIKKELDNNQFQFPESFDLGIRLKDMLDDDVDEKFYLPDESLCGIERFFKQAQETLEENNCNIGDTINAFNKTVNNNKKNINESQDLKLHGNNFNQRKIVHQENGICRTITGQGHSGNEPKVIQSSKIRKLTPKECFRLMGFDDTDFELAEKTNSNSQLYKQAGNSIVVDVLYYILLKLYKAMPYLFDDLQLSSYFSGIGAFEKALDRLYKSINDKKIYNRYENFQKSQIDIRHSICDDKPVLIGGIGEKNFGKQYRQGNRIYDANHIAACLTAQPVGCAGGYSYLYLIK